MNRPGCGPKTGTAGKKDVDKAMKVSDRGKKITAVCLLYISALLVPLYVDKGYFNLIEAKAGIYRKTAIPFLLAGMLFLLLSFALRMKDPKKKTFRFCLTDCLLVLIPAWALFSSYLSMDMKLSLMGTLGWAMGSLMTLLLAMSTLFLSHSLCFHPWLMVPVMAANLFIFILAALQSAGADPFGLLKGIDPGSLYAYLSTIGQKNSFSGYLCLIVPLFWGFFITCTDLFSKILYGTVSGLGILCMILCESDSLYAGLGLCALFMLPYVLSSAQYAERASVLLFMYGLCLLITGHLPAFSEKAGRMAGISRIMLSIPCTAAVFVLSALLYVFSRKCMGKGEGKEKWSRYLLILLELILFGSIIGALIYSCLHFDDNWGTRRGLIWRTAWEAFAGFSFREKVTGIGPDMLALVFSPLRQSHSFNVLEAHCEPLQVLVSQGIAGLGLYLAFWISLFARYFRGRLWDKSSAVFVFPLAAYLGQSLFCSVYPVTGVMFSVMAGLYLAETGQKQDSIQ